MRRCPACGCEALHGAFCDYHYSVLPPELKRRGKIDDERWEQMMKFLKDHGYMEQWYRTNVVS